MLLLRSLAFQAYFSCSVIVYALVVLICAPLPYATRFAIARHWGRSVLWAARTCCGLSLVVEGREHIPRGPAVIMLKHTSTFETLAQLLVFPPQTWVLKRELLWIPLFGWGLAALRPIAINRSAGRTAVMQVIAKGRERLAQGLWVAIFPEGTRMPPGTTRKYGISAAALAQDAGVPIVPVAHNAGDFWPRRSLLKRPGVVRFCIGPVIDSSARPPKETNLVVQEWIEGRMREISSAYRR